MTWGALVVGGGSDAVRERCPPGRRARRSFVRIVVAPGQGSRRSEVTAGARKGPWRRIAVRPHARHTRPASILPAAPRRSPSPEPLILVRKAHSVLVGTECVILLGLALCG